ncbi:hypothetical protein Btru_068166 [Bulinus truncatus]|nr:hypothetical protein Btru_068166 [Bulinus truncatus]
MLMSAGHAVSSYLSGTIFRENVIDQKGYRGETFAGLCQGSWTQTGDSGAPGKQQYSVHGLNGTFNQQVLQVNSSTLSNFASVSQRMGLVPVLSVDVLWLAGAAETSSDSQNILREVLTSLFKALQDYHVFLEIVLSSQQDLTKSLAILDAVNKCPIKKLTILSFCFSNVIQEGLAEIWAGNDKNVTKSKEELVRRLKGPTQANIERWENDRFVRAFLQIASMSWQTSGHEVKQTADVE